MNIFWEERFCDEGFTPEREEIKYFVSTGRKDVRGGAAEFLKSGPEKVEACFKVMGKVTCLLYTSDAADE